MCGTRELSCASCRAGAGRAGEPMWAVLGRVSLGVSGHVTNVTAKGGKAEAELKITEVQ